MNQKRWWVVLWLSLGMVIAYTDRVNLTAAMPEIGKALQLDEEQQGMAMSAFFWTYTLGQIPAGMLVDRRGVRLLYTAGIVLWSVASAFTVFVTGLWGLVATRLVVGLGESVVTSSSLRYIREHFAEGAGLRGWRLHDRHENRPGGGVAAGCLSGGDAGLAGDVSDDGRGQFAVAGTVARVGAQG